PEASPGWEPWEVIPSKLCAACKRRGAQQVFQKQSYEWRLSRCRISLHTMPAVLVVRRRLVCLERLHVRSSSALSRLLLLQVTPVLTLQLDDEAMDVAPPHLVLALRQ